MGRIKTRNPQKIVSHFVRLRIQIFAEHDILYKPDNDYVWSFIWPILTHLGMFYDNNHLWICIIYKMFLLPICNYIIIHFTCISAPTLFSLAGVICGLLINFVWSEEKGKVNDKFQQPELERQLIKLVIKFKLQLLF